MQKDKNIGSSCLGRFFYKRCDKHEKENGIFLYRNEQKKKKNVEFDLRGVATTEKGIERVSFGE